MNDELKEALRIGMNIYWKGRMPMAPLSMPKGEAWGTVVNLTRKSVVCVRSNTRYYIPYDKVVRVEQFGERGFWVVWEKEKAL